MSLAGHAWVHYVATIRCDVTGCDSSVTAEGDSHEDSRYNVADVAYNEGWTELNGDVFCESCSKRG